MKVGTAEWTRRGGEMKDGVLDVERMRTMPSLLWSDKEIEVA
jgi:hypothetical protein